MNINDLVIKGYIKIKEVAKNGTGIDDLGD